MVIVFVAVLIPFIPSLAMDMMAMILVERPEDVDGWYSYRKLLQWKGYDVAAVAVHLSTVILNPLHKDA